MAILDVVFGLWQILTLNVQLVGYELDEETRERMEQRAEMLDREMTRLWQEVEEQWSQEQRSQEQMNQEQRDQEQSSFAWASMLFSALQCWQCWAVAGVLVLLIGLCWWLRKRSREPEREDESSDRGVEEEHKEENDHANDPGRNFEDPIQKPVQNWDRDCEAVKNLVEKIIVLFNYDVFNACYPVLQKATEVGSTFEGWSPHEEDITYSLLVCLKPPDGHTFQLEPGPEWPMRNFHIHVEFMCTCEREQLTGKTRKRKKRLTEETRLTGKTRCFLHDPKEEQSRKECPNILQDLCTDSYLDVQKTAEWFQKMMKRFWKDLPVSATHQLMVLPSNRSCKFLVTQSCGKRFLIELLFGVQEGDSDIFLSSQYTEAAYTPSTMWLESYAVAEMKFFSYIALQAQPDSCHLRCLQLCARSLLGRDFSTYTLKTVVMHLLTTIPLSDWHKDSFMQRLQDIMQYLQRRLKKKCLYHFFIGNANLPEEIILPQELRMAEPLNIFQHLEHDLDAHEEARLDFLMLQHQLRGLLFHGH